jgi:hypothetical protein
VKLFDYYKNDDFGVEHVFTLFKGKRRSFIQLGLSWNEIMDSPYLQLSFGNNRVFDILFWVWKIGFCLELLGCNWKSWNEDT